MLALLDSSLVGPVNVGNPDERSMLDLAHFVLEVTGSSSDIVFEPLPVDDPTRRCPDITLARRSSAGSPRSAYARESSAPSTTSPKVERPMTESDVTDTT